MGVRTQESASGPSEGAPLLPLWHICILPEIDKRTFLWSPSRGSRLLNASPMNPPAPFATLSDHTLPVTDICIGLGPFPQCRILTASLDSTVKVRVSLVARAAK